MSEKELLLEPSLRLVGVFRGSSWLHVFLGGLAVQGKASGQGTCM